MAMWKVVRRVEARTGRAFPCRGRHGERRLRERSFVGGICGSPRLVRAVGGECRAARQNGGAVT